LHVLILSAGKVLKNPHGGEDLFSRLLATWLAKFHQQVTLMGVQYGGVRVKKMTYDNTRSEYIPKKRESHNQTSKFKYSYLFYSLRAVFWISQVLRILSIHVMNSINIIHAQDCGYTGLAAIIAGKILHVPVIITLHGIRYEQIESNPYVNNILKWMELKIENRLDTFTLSKASIVTIVSPTFKSYVERLAPKSTIVSIPVAVKSKHFEFSELNRQRIRKELDIQNEFKIIGYVGRLSHEKNLSTLIYSFADALKQDPYLILILVGEGPMEFELKEQAMNLQIKDRVIFSGFRNDIGKILSCFDIFVLPSFMEGTSHSLLEAMTCSCAILCSDISANRELVTHNKDAILVNPNDRDGFKNAILLLASNNELRRKLGFNAKTNSSQFDQEIVFPKILSLYEKLFNGAVNNIT